MSTAARSASHSDELVAAVGRAHEPRTPPPPAWWGPAFLVIITAAFPVDLTMHPANGAQVRAMKNCILVSAPGVGGWGGGCSRHQQPQQTYFHAGSGWTTGHSGGAFHRTAGTSLLPCSRGRGENPAAPPPHPKSMPKSLLIQSHLQQSPLSSSLVVMNSL